MMTPSEDAPAVLAQACEDAQRKIGECRGLPSCHGHQALTDGLSTILRCEAARWRRERDEAHVEKGLARDRREAVLRRVIAIVAWLAGIGGLIVLARLVHQVGTLAANLPKGITP